MQYGLSNNDKCVICGEYVPEGRMICYKCEQEAYQESRSKPRKFSLKEFIADITDYIIKNKLTIDVD